MRIRVRLLRPVVLLFSASVVVAPGVAAAFRFDGPGESVKTRPSQTGEEVTAAVSLEAANVSPLVDGGTLPVRIGVRRLAGTGDERRRSEVAQATGQPSQPEVLTNDSITLMVRAGIDEGVILVKIETSEVNFDLRTEALVALRQAGVSDRIFGAMLTRMGKGAPGASGSKPQPIETSAGVTILGEWWHSEEGSLEFLEDGGVVAREHGKLAPTSARYVLSGGRLKIDLMGSEVSLLDAEVVELTDKVLRLKRPDGTLLVWQRSPVTGGGPTGSVGTPSGSVVVAVPGGTASVPKRPVKLDELMAGDREAGQFSRAEKVLQRDKKRVWDAVMAFLADAGGDVVSSDFEEGYIVTKLKEYMKFITLFRVRYYVTVEPISDQTTKLSALGVRYRREQRTWRRWDRGIVSGGAGQLLIEAVEAQLK